MSGLVCWFLIPQLFEYIFNISGINKFLSGLIVHIVELFPVNSINEFLAQYNIPPLENDHLALSVTTSSIAQIVIQFTLPLRSILCGLWYKELHGALPAKTEKKKSSKKRPSEKLMEESHKRLDKNILKRAMNKDE